MSGCSHALSVHHRGASGEHRFRGSLGVHPQSVARLVDRRHQLERRIEVELATPLVRRASTTLTSAPSDAAALSNASSVGSPFGPDPSACIEVGIAAGGHASWRGRGVRRRPARTWVCVSVDVDVAVERGDGHDAHAILRERAGLVRADHAGRSEGLHRAEPLHESTATCEHPNAERQRERDRRQQTLGHVRDDETDGKHRGVGEGQTGEPCRAAGTRDRFPLPPAR